MGSDKAEQIMAALDACAGRLTHAYAVGGQVTGKDVAAVNSAVEAVRAILAEPDSPDAVLHMDDETRRAEGFAAERARIRAAVLKARRIPAFIDRDVSVRLDDVLAIIDAGGGA